MFIEALSSDEVTTSFTVTRTDHGRINSSEMRVRPPPIDGHEFNLTEQRICAL
jgi:hypothetical protein